MEHAVLEQFKRILETMVADLERPLRRREQIAIENTPDALDEVQNAAERELAIRQLEHESSRLRSVKGALRRIEEGTYGECIRCESSISIKRLKAVPWTPYCLDCQDIADQSSTDTEPDFVQFTDRGPKIMRAGQSAKSATGESQLPLLQEPKLADSYNELTPGGPQGLSASAPAWLQKKQPGSERRQHKIKTEVEL